jgi:predicted nicotinamide N-methyase
MTKRQSDVILRPEEMRNEIGLLKNEADNLIAVGDPDSKKLAKEKLKQAEAYEKYVNAYEEFTDYYHRDRYLQ